MRTASPMIDASIRHQPGVGGREGRKATAGSAAATGTRDHVALLRSTKSAGNRHLPSDRLRSAAAALGLFRIRSALHNGNLVFDPGPHVPQALESLLERGLVRQLGLDTACFVRSAKEWRMVIAGNPFQRQARANPCYLQVAFFKSAPAPRDVDKLRGAIKAPDGMAAAGRHIYAVYPNGFSQRTPTAAVIEEACGAACAIRTWNTVLRIESLLEERAGAAATV